MPVEATWTAEARAGSATAGHAQRTALLAIVGNIGVDELARRAGQVADRPPNRHVIDIQRTQHSIVSAKEAVGVGRSCAREAGYIAFSALIRRGVGVRSLWTVKDAREIVKIQLSAQRAPTRKTSLVGCDTGETTDVTRHAS